ncbi:periplasmic binding protein-like II [Neocallimastix lanati (nom. inval.)]|nr:periplasmic binding protein-like II [Neocallimastix sp. JGI-2020a]
MTNFTYKGLIDNVINKYKEYSSEHNENLNVNVEYYEDDEVEYGVKIEKLLDEKSTEYDLYFYNIHHIYRFSNKLLNLKKIMSIFSVENFSEGATLKSGFIDDKLVGVPFICHYGVMYYNKDLLSKYELPVPTTWEELVKTIDHIYNGEISENNNDIIAYLGNIPDSYTAINTIQEMIYSYRDDVNNEYMPDYRSENAIEAISLLKNILVKYSSPENFKLNQVEILEKIKTGNVLFARIFNVPLNDPDLHFTLIPGKNDTISSSSIGGYHIGVPSYLDEDRQKKISLILDYLLSEEIQSYLINEENMYSAYNGIYKTDNTDQETTSQTSQSNKRDEINSPDEILEKEKVEFCNKINCNMISNIQFYNIPYNYYENYDDYVNAFLEIVNDYFFNPDDSKNITVEETLAKIDDLTRNYDVEITSSVGSVTIIILGVTGVIMFASYLLMNDRKYSIYFMFLNNTYWTIFIFGSILILSYAFVSLGEIDQEKCNLRFLVLSLGVPISFSPLLLRLIVLYPETNKISEHVNRNFSNYLCCHVLFELVLCTVYLLAPFDVTNHLLNISDGVKNFRSCECKNALTKGVLVVDILEKGLEIFIFAVLIFAEWNIKATKSDIYSITIAIIFDIIAFTIFAVFYFMDFNNRYIYFIVKVGPVLLFGLSNFFLIYVWKFVIMFTSEKEDMVDKEAYIQKKTNIDTYKNITRMSLSKTGRTESFDNNIEVDENSNESFINRIIKCHYETKEFEGSITSSGSRKNNQSTQSKSGNGNNATNTNTLPDRNVRNFPSPN